MFFSSFAIKSAQKRVQRYKLYLIYKEKFGKYFKVYPDHLIFKVIQKGKLFILFSIYFYLLVEPI